jgi:hypothetical protein
VSAEKVRPFARAKYADYRQHQRTAGKRNHQAYAQAPRVSGNHTHQWWHQRAAQGRQREHDATYFSCSGAIPFGKPRNQNRKNAGEAQTCEKGTAEQRQVGMTGQKNGLPRGCKEKSCDRDRNFFQVEKNGRRGSSTAKQPRKEEHRRQRPGVAAPGCRPLGVRGRPIGGSYFCADIHEKQNSEQSRDSCSGNLTAGRT